MKPRWLRHFLEDPFEPRGQLLRRTLRDLGVLITNRNGQRQIKARNYAFLAAGALTPVIAVEADGVRYYLSTADKELGRIFYIYRYYERPLMKRALELLDKHRDGGSALRGRAFVDVGANVGTATLCALAHFGAGSAYSFEPSPDSFALLEQNLLANGLSERARTFPAAVSDREDEVELELSHFNWGDHRVRVPDAAPGDRFHESQRRVTTVPAITLDSLVESGVIDPGGVGLIWIDTQGHEAHVLAGGRSLLRSRAPVVTEYWPYGLRRAGGLERMHALVEEHFTGFVDLGPQRDGHGSALRPAAKLAELEGLYDTGVTDLLLLNVQSA